MGQSNRQWRHCRYRLLNLLGQRIELRNDSSGRISWSSQLVEFQWNSFCTSTSWWRLLLVHCCSSKQYWIWTAIFRYRNLRCVSSQRTKCTNTCVLVCHSDKFHLVATEPDTEWWFSSYWIQDLLVWSDKTLQLCTTGHYNDNQPRIYYIWFDSRSSISSR